MKLKADWFLLGMAAAIGLAWLFPSPGAAGGFLHPELLTKAGVALIFFLHGVALSFGALKAGALNWRLHLLVQLCTFLLFPLLGLLVMAALGEHVPAGLKLGFFYLCALPSTVSSSVAMTAAARGNVAGAVFNATLSSLIGVVLTPLWIGAVLNTTGHPVPIGPVMIDLVRWLVLPLAAGQLCRPWLGDYAKRHKAGINVVDRATILLLVYTSFCDSFQQGVWTGNGALTLLIVLAVTGGIFAVAVLATSRLAGVFHFDRADRITAIFCGSKKTLASGVPMAKLIFGASPALGLILLPIMIYHPLQLVICGFLARRWAKEQTLTAGH
jgi:solute carrier family 10 (sodium/bile acid cotransporter), member 7